MSFLMEYPLPPEAKAFQQEVRRFVSTEMTHALTEELESGEWGTGQGPLGRKFLKKLGEKKWLGLTWPVEYGGLGKTFMHKFALTEELDYRHAPWPGMGSFVVGPCLMMFGTPEQKKTYLPRIAAGEWLFALGYTEPNAGSDLASLSLSAVEDGDDFVLNGQKIFQSESHSADFVWLAARTDATVAKHKGISLFIVPTHSKGMTLQPMYTMGGHRNNIVYYDNVRIPKGSLVGEKNKGWYYVAAALDLERIFPIGGLMREVEELIAFAKSSHAGNPPAMEDAVQRNRISQVLIEAHVLRTHAFRVAWMQDQSLVPNIEASIQKLLIREMYQRVATLAYQVLGQYGQIRKGHPLAVLHGKFEHMARHSPTMTITAGSSEIQRNIIATRGLGLPR
jgi:alkylation response protein AidB-like acyl-CoA dehydrogenase